MGKSTTPEGRVKAAVDKILDRFGVMYDKPVLTGYGSRMLDYVCCVPTPAGGLYLTIETKRPDNKQYLTGRQRELCRRAFLAGAKVFIISGPDGMQSLMHYLARVTNGGLVNPTEGADTV